MLVTTPRLNLDSVDRAAWLALLDGDPGPAIEGYPTVGDLVMARLVVDGHLEAGEWGPWQVRERATGLLIGGVGFKGPPRARDSDDGSAPVLIVEIGYGLAPAARGRGYATEAVRALVEYAASQGVTEVVAETDLDNDASMRVLIKSGFVETERTDSAVWWRRDLRASAV